tara:strand:- start:1905 stop:2597 length:693 start_codon:yes stop_codon:yes gene_type:complete
MTTIVSAFIFCPNNTNRTIENYIKYGIQLLKLPQNKIIFIDEKVFEFVEEYQNKQTIFIKTKLEDLYLNKYKIKLEVNTDNPGKDSYDYFTIQCNKTEWVRQAINKNYFKSTSFIWIDFGIYHILSNINLKNINKIYEKIRIPSIWNLNETYNYDINKDICWYFAGGVFGGSTNKLLQFADLVKDKCIEYIVNKKHLMWEVNIWYLIWKKNNELFDPYYADHNSSMVENY